MGIQEPVSLVGPRSRRESAIVKVNVAARLLGGGERSKRERGSAERSLVNRRGWGWRKRVKLAPPYRAR